MEGITKLRTFLDDVWGELKRTSWPSKPEVQGTTIVVIVTVFIVAGYLYVVDLLLATAHQFVVNLAS